MTRRYWALNHITLVNWYLFAAVDIEIKGIVALTGPNGSGKSSILDAIQTVLTGAHGRHLELNARVQTDKGARRTIRDYVLGAIDDDEDGVTHMRSQGSRAYILLGFRRTDGSQEATLGLCASARLDTPHEDVEARFVLMGRILTAKDVATVGEDASGTWSEAHPWSRVAAKLRADASLQLDTESGPEIFVRTLCRMIGPENGTIDSHKFLRNLKNSAAFKPVSSTTDFVRGFILDGQRLNLGALRDSIGRYRDIRMKIDEFKRRITEADDLAERAEKVRTRERTLLNHRLTLAQGRLHLDARALDLARSEREATSVALARITAALPGLLEAEGRHEALLDEHTRLAATDNSARSAEDSEKEASLAVERIGRLKAQLAPFFRLADDITQAAKLVELSDPKVANAMASFGSGISGAAVANAEKLSASLSKSMAAVAEQADLAEGLAAAALVDVSRRIEALEANLERLRNGKRDLGSPTRMLMEALAAQKIAAVPLSELVTSVDKDWRQTIEAILGDACEALIVPPAKYETAQKLYRTSNVRGSMLVNTTKTDTGRRAKANSLASAVECPDAHGRGFLDFRLGGVAMVKSHADLAKAESAATADLMFASGRTVRKLFPPRFPRLGLTMDGGGMESATEELGFLREQARERHIAVGICRSATRLLTSVIEGIRDLDYVATKAWLDELAEAERSEVRHRMEAKRHRASKGGSIQKRLELARQALKDVRAQRAAGDQELARLEERLSDRVSREVAASNAEESSRNRALAVITDHGLVFSPQEMEDSLRWAHAPLPEAPETKSALSDPESRESRDGPRGTSLEAHLHYLEFNLVDYQARRVANDRNNVVLLVGDYVIRHGITKPPFLEPLEDGDADTRFGQASAWLSVEAEMLRRQALVDYEDQATQAHNDAILHFKGDFIGKMRGAFEEMQIRLRELNRQLAKRDFHGLTYRFDRKANLSHRDMIDLIEKAGDPEFEIGLGGDGGTDPVSRALRRLQELALDPEADLSEIEDPRRYFEFDISMGRGGIERTTMSKRMGTGSGGQVQVPYYVAICAALAATYYPDRAGEDGGMALAIFDEAFNRMDTAVISEVVSFMRDVGLQPFIAAPDKERATFIQFVDTMIGISRNGKSVLVDVQYVKPLVHKRFQAENPALLGFEAFQQRAEIARPMAEQEEALSPAAPGRRGRAKAAARR
jgi:energy-coupling factor transporter ATP-binding protein EcfA2